MKCGIALGLHSYFSDEGALSLFSKIIMIEYLTSIFVIPCSIFAFSKFLFRFDWTLAASGDDHTENRM